MRKSGSGKKIAAILVALVVLFSSTLACGPSGPSTSTPAVTISTKVVKITGTPKIVTSTPLPTPTPTIPPTIDPRWTTYTTADGLADDHVHSVVAAPNGTLWCLSPEDASHFDGETWTAYPLDGRARLLPQRAYAASNDSLWIASIFSGSAGVLRFDGETWTSYTIHDGLVSNATSAVTVAPDGMVWISTSSGISRFDGETWTTFTIEDGLGSNIVHFITVAPSGLIFALTDKGISYFDGKTWATYLELEASGWKGPFVIDYEDALWLGDGGRIYRLDRKEMIPYDMQDGMPGAFITAIAVGVDGAIWIGTTGGAARFDRESWSAYTTADGLSENFVTSIAVTPDGAVWFGTNDGLSRYKP